MKWAGLLVLAIICYGFSSCKKDNSAPATPVNAIVGKWYITTHISAHYSGTYKIDSAHVVNFGVDDFIQYFEDGSGLQSAAATPAPSLNVFKYTIQGINLLVFSSVLNPGQPETITSLTATSLSIHYVLSVVDPNTGNEVTEYNDLILRK